jgi:hypothetical protein
VKVDILIADLNMSNKEIYIELTEESKINLYLSEVNKEDEALYPYLIKAVLNYIDLNANI